MRRWSWVPLLPLVLLAAACIPGPPPAWVAPTVLSIDVQPAPVVAGEPFSISVTASDDRAVRDIEIDLRTPYWLNPLQNNPFPLAQCEPTSTVEPAQIVTKDFTCTLPSFVPNGTWIVNAHVEDGEGIGYRGHGTGTFELIGGSEDRDKPVYEHVEVSQPVVPGVPFTVTVRVSDAHLSPDPVRMTVANDANVQAPDPAPRVVWDCGDVTPTPLTPTLQELVFTCEIGAEAVLGRYSAYMIVEDLIGHYNGRFIGFQVVAPT